MESPHVRDVAFATITGARRENRNARKHRDRHVYTYAHVCAYACAAISCLCCTVIRMRAHVFGLSASRRRWAYTHTHKHAPAHANRWATISMLRGGIASSGGAGRGETHTHKTNKMCARTEPKRSCAPTLCFLPWVMAKFNHSDVCSCL